MPTENAAPKLADVIVCAPGRIAVLVDKKETRTPSGLLLPEDVVKTIHEERATRGTVIAIGEDLLEEPDTFVALGDYVVFGKYSGTLLKLSDPKTRQETERVIVLSQKDILCKIVDPEMRDAVKVRG